MKIGRIVVRGPLVLLAVVSLGGLVSPARSSAATLPQEVVFWSGLQGTNGVVSQAALTANSAKPFVYLIPGQTVIDVAELGPAFDPAPAGAVMAYWQVNCDTSQGLSKTYVSPEQSLAVPGSDNSWMNPPIPTMTISQDVPIPSACTGSGNASISNPDGWVYMCIVDKDPPDVNNGTYCNSVAFGILTAGAAEPGLPFPSGPGTLYQWVSPSELTQIEATGTIKPAPSTFGQYFYATYDGAQNVKNLYEGYDLIQASYASGSIFDYSVGVTGILNGNAFFLPDFTIESLYGIAEVAGG
jgi:hypothetical protein